MKGPSKTKSASLRSAPSAPASTRLCADPIKDDRMRRWAGKIMSELPSGMGDALIVLKYAERLLYWAAMDDPPFEPKKRGRAAR